MPENPLEQARFDHVDAAGQLVFAVGNLRFAVDVDEPLERALLEAKQIRSEARQRQPHHGETLPISQIQSLIRAGAEPSRVAQRYGLSEALVRRFSAAVETEKQYAIEQFLAVPAPKQSRMRTVSELIESTLVSARTGMESLSWRATRRGLEPWRITAQFPSSGHPVRAEWLWNMHDNTVTCVNAAARHLFGERISGETGGAASEDTPASGALPGDAIRSARIERAVSQWVTPTPPEQQHDGPAAPADGETGGPDVAIHPSVPQPVAPPLPFAAAPTGTADAAPSGGAPMPGADDPTAAGGEAAPVASAAAPGAIAAPAADALAPAAGASEAPRVSEPHEPKPRRRSGRSAVPSWDEILFGE